MTISISASPNVLIEEEGTLLALTINSSEPIPEGGLVLTISSDTVNALGQFDVLATQVENVQILGVNDDTSGFRIRLNEQTGTIILPAFDDNDADSPLDLTFNVEPGEGYTVDESAGSVTLTIEDAEGGTTPTPEPTPEPTPGTGLPLVSLNTGPDYLVESEGTVSAYVFNITGGTIPEGGLVVSVNAPNLSEFDLDAINVSEGGEIVAVRSDGFDIRLTDFTVLVDLPIANDGETEGLETASFSLVAGEGYEVNSAFSSGEFTLADNRAEVPANFGEPNDIISLASPIELSEGEATTLTASTDFTIGNRYLNQDGTYTYIDATEDVDFYSFKLQAGDIISIDVDSNTQRGNPPATIPEYKSNDGFGPFTGLRVFDSEGQELAATWLGQGPGELFTSADGYLEFEAPEDGTYYLGLSNFISSSPDAILEIEGFTREVKYNPFVPGGGDNESYLQFDLPFIGQYDLTINLNPEVLLELPQFVPDSASNSNSADNSDTESGSPTVSLDFLTFTLDPETEDLMSPYLIEGTPGTDSALVLTFETKGEIPEEGILVNINSDNYLRQYVTRRSFQSPPFTPGAELEKLLYDETGRETGFQLRILEPYTFITLNAQSVGWEDDIQPDVEAPKDVTWFIEPGEGYTIDSNGSEITATYYNPEQVPEPTMIPEVGISINTTKLIESEQTIATLTFTLSEPPPAEGVIVQVNGSSGGILPQFDIFNLEVDGGVFPAPNFNFSGLYFKVTEQEATITLPVFEDPFDEGLQSFSFSLEETAYYTIDSDASVAEFTIADNPDSVVEVSLSTDTEVLVESENSTGVLTFNLTANPPAEGVAVTVDAPNLSEFFDVNALTVTGGEITEITDSGFSLNITDATATVELPLLADGATEGLETATFSLVESLVSTINPDTKQAVITLYDNPDQVPVTEEIDGNNTIIQADDLNLNPENLSTTVRGGIFSLEPEQGYNDNKDFSEDVDFYSFDMKAGETVKIDVDAVEGLELSLYEGVDLRLDSELRLFDANGNELASVNNAAAPDEEFSRDPYLEFTATEAGTYYVGVSQLGNRNYDPNVEGSGSGWIFPEIGVFSGEYDLNVSLIPGNVVEQPTTQPVFGSLEQDIIEVSGTSQLIFAGDSDDLIDASISSTGNNRIYGGNGDDTVILGMSDRIVAGAGADKFFATSGGDNILTGGAGADQFWIATAEIPDSANIITDFTLGEDVLGIAGLGIGFDDLSITQQEDNTLIAANGSDLAILQGIGAASLSVYNFAFA